MFIAQVEKSFIYYSEIYFRTLWFCFAFAYATIFEKPLFLPVKFCIKFKTVLLTHKCLHSSAPTYSKNLINSRSVSARYSLRVNDDNWLLQTITTLNFARSHSVFSYAPPKIWNSLSLSLLEIGTLSFFKKRLKAYYFNLAFEDVTTV